MALTRKALKAMGLTEEQVDSIIEAHTETVDGLKEQIKTYKADAEKLEGVQKQLDELKAGDGEDWKGKYEAEKAAHGKTKSEYAAKETAAMNERLFRAKLTEVGITGKRADQIVKMTDMSQFAVEDGAYKDDAAVEKHIREEYSEFVPTKKTKGADVPTPPTNSGKRMTREEIYKKDDKGRYVLSTAERQKALAENMAAGDD